MRIYVCPTEREEGGDGGRHKYCIFMGNMGDSASRARPVQSGPVRPHRNVAPGRAGQLGLIYIINFEYFIVCLGKDTAGGTASSS